MTTPHTYGPNCDECEGHCLQSKMIQVTITGQVTLRALIEMLELKGVSVSNAETDGIQIAPAAQRPNES